VKTLFTIHAGEFLVGSFIERKFRSLNIWVPSKDTGVDLLVTNPENQRAVSLQVKFSRDFLDTFKEESFQASLRACGWWKLSPKKAKESKADYWVFVLLGFAHRSTDFVIIKPSELLRRLANIHSDAQTIQSYFWVTKDKRCWETRGLKQSEQTEIAEGRYVNADRDFTQYLNHWEPIQGISLTARFGLNQQKKKGSWPFDQLPLGGITNLSNRLKKFPT
jgi:hypothetical protein